MSAITAEEIDAVAVRYPQVFTARRLQRSAPLIALALLVLYGFYVSSFFSIPSVIAGGNWQIAGSYLADWVSYEVRPDVEIDGDTLSVRHPRFSSYNESRQPPWLTFAPDRSSAGVAIGDATIEVRPTLVTINRGAEVLVIDIVADEAVSARTALPVWATQRAPGGKVLVELGLAGRVEIEADEVKIRHRTLGWENFVFDYNSPFWGRSAGEVWALIWSGEQLKPGVSNLALAWDNIWNNSEWQHGDVWIKLLQTVVMAFVGTLFATIIAFPLAFVAARNITPSRVANFTLKRLFDFLRSVDTLIWALFFTRAFGPGPLAGISAIFVTDTGTLGKTYSEALENIDDKQREGVVSVGAPPVLVQRYGVVPQVLPVFLSQSLYFWESNTRSATIIGAVGAGGIGLKLWEAMRTNSDWENVAYMVLLILAVVFIFDNISNALRSRLIGRG